MANPAEKPKVSLPKREVLDPAIKDYVRGRSKEIQKGLRFTRPFEEDRLSYWLKENGVEDPKKCSKLVAAAMETLGERVIDKSPEKKKLSENSFEKLNQVMDELYGKSETGIGFVDKMVNNVTQKGIMKITGIVALLSFAAEYLSQKKDANGNMKHGLLVKKLKEIIAKLDPNKEVKDKNGKAVKKPKTPEKKAKDGFEGVTAFLKIPRKGIIFEEPKAKEYEPFLKEGAGHLITRISESVQGEGGIALVQKGIKANKHLDSFKYQLSDVNLDKTRASYIAAVLMGKEVKKRSEDAKRKPIAEWNLEDCRQFVEDVKKEDNFTFELVSI